MCLFRLNGILFFWHKTGDMSAASTICVTEIYTLMRTVYGFLWPISKHADPNLSTRRRSNVRFALSMSLVPRPEAVETWIKFKGSSAKPLDRSVREGRRERPGRAACVQE